MKFGRLLARLFIGAMFVGHGTQKWFGWFGGPGIEGTTGMMSKLGLAPARANAHAASASETLGGVGIALGAFTPLAAASLIGTMITAIRTVHLKNGFWSSGGGYEYNLTIIAALLLLVDGGPGPLSLDGAFGIEETGTGVALAALAAGAIGSTVTLAAAKAAAQKAAAEEASASTPAAGPSAA
jgi:putative oxidoreductase